MLDGRLHRGVGGAAGEIGYLPVPGVPLPQDITHPATGAFQSLIGAQALLPLAAGYGFARHFGYPTLAHVAALRRLGPCPIHRRSFAPVRSCLP